jgi:hypothetical protein
MPDNASTLAPEKFSVSIPEMLIEFGLGEGKEPITVDVIEARLFLDRLYKETEDRVERAAKTHEWLKVGYGGVDLSVSQIWQFILTIDSAYDYFKKKFDPYLKSVFGMDSTPSS